jgi:hypothetical protein
VDTSDFTLTTSGVVGASVVGATGGPRIYTVAVNAGSSEGTIRLDVTDDDTIVDGVGTPLGGAGLGNGNFTAGQLYHIDRTPPAPPATPTDDGEFTSVTTVRFFWTAGTDGRSGVASYYLRVGSAPGWGDVFAGNVGNVLGRTVAGHSGQTLYARVRCSDRAGNSSLWSNISDGITIDTYRPRLIEATATNGQVVEVAFNEPVVNADQAANYSCTPGLSIVGVTPLSSTQYRLYTTEQQAGGTYTLSVSSYVKDRAGNPIDPAAMSRPFTAGPFTRVGPWHLYR